MCMVFFGPIKLHGAFFCTDYVRSWKMSGEDNMQSKVFPEMELTFQCSLGLSQPVYCVFPALPHLTQLMKHSLISSWADSGAREGKNPTNLRSIVGLRALGLTSLIASSNTPDAIRGMLEKKKKKPVWWMNFSCALTHMIKLISLINHRLQRGNRGTVCCVRARKSHTSLFLCDWRIVCELPCKSMPLH